jgi:hypothetical protein
MYKFDHFKGFFEILLCDREFTAYVELDGLTDMDLLKVAFEDELRYYNWEDYLWAVSISTYDYDLLPQFDGPEDVNIDGAEVYIWWTGWVQPESKAPGFLQTDRSPSPYSDDYAPGTTLTDSSEEGFLSDLKPGEPI